MKMRSRTLAIGLFLALIGIACVALFAGRARAEEGDWSWGDPYPPISGNGWGISKEGTLTVVTNAGWRDFLANGPGEWIWEYDEYMRNERVKSWSLVRTSLLYQSMIQHIGMMIRCRKETIN